MRLRQLQPQQPYCCQSVTQVVAQQSRAFRLRRSEVRIAQRLGQTKLECLLALRTRPVLGCQPFELHTLPFDQRHVAVLLPPGTSGLDIALEIQRGRLLERG